MAGGHFRARGTRPPRSTLDPVTARPRWVAPGALSGAWLTVARRGAFSGELRPPASGAGAAAPVPTEPGTATGAPSDQHAAPSRTDAAPPQHHRQEHRAHEDQRRPEARAPTRPPAARRCPPGGRRPRPVASRWSSSSRRPRRTRSPGYLGAGYVVEASVGHIRDLPRNAADVPAEHKGAAWARLGVDVDNSFEPLYVVSPDRKQQVSRLKQLVKGASEVYLATDEDREGEAIAWHLVDTLKPRVPVHRMVFHEITPEAIARAVANPRELDTALVDAQETRRILDRLYGYEVSPVLWKKVLPKLSAGRVQSVATRIVVERERERMAFHAADYWSLEGTFAVPRPGAATDEGEPTTVRAKLVSVDDSRVATGRDFDPATGRVSGDVVHLDEAGARGLAARLEGRQVDRQPGRREALPAPSVRAVHHVDAADGRRPQARLVLGADDAGGAAAVRERPHHLHAYRLDEPVAGGDQRRPAAGPRAVRRRLRPGRGAALQEQGQGRPGGARGDPPGR